MKLESKIKLLSNDQPLLLLEQIELFDDGSGAAGLLTINSGSFTCSKHPFYFEDFIPFCQKIPEMYKTLHGKAELRFRYEQDFLELTMDKIGHVVVKGLVGSTSEQQLTYNFQSDQTCLVSMVSSVNDTLDEIKEATKILSERRTSVRSSKCWLRKKKKNLDGITI